MIGHALTDLLTAAPLAASAPSLTDGQFGHPASVRLGQDGDIPLSDPERCMDDRVGDILQRMTLEEKAGRMFHTPLLTLPGGEFDGGNSDARLTATFINRAQELALQTRLEAPTATPTEPRHSFTENIRAGFKAGSFPEWPEVLGLAAAWDPTLVCKFAEVVREEYRAAGFRCAPHPVLDLATEPPWARLSDIWGEDANLTAKMIVPYMYGDGFGLTPWLPNNFGYQLVLSRLLIAAGARAMMPYYSRPIGTKIWASKLMPAKTRGAEHLSEPERMLRILNAGVDQFGGEHVTEMLVDSIWDGSVSEEHFDTPVRGLLREKFPLRYFDKAFVDPDAAERTVGNDYFVQLGAEAQRRCCTLLTNNDTVPLRRTQSGSKEADFALLKMAAPRSLRSAALERTFASGSFEFDEELKARRAKIYAAVSATYGSSANAVLDVVFGLLAEP
ncbi:hypothetical protein DL771_004400 [Monosporascus sp. 5C6A]|nr:hypothetical protein DL771_004400 [Monosporascus sp. 5C6A]